MVSNRGIVVGKILAGQVANRNTFLRGSGVAVNDLLEQQQQGLILEQAV